MKLSSHLILLTILMYNFSILFVVVVCIYAFYCNNLGLFCCIYAFFTVKNCFVELFFIKFKLLRY